MIEFSLLTKLNPIGPADFSDPAQNLAQTYKYERGEPACRLASRDKGLQDESHRASEGKKTDLVREMSSALMSI